LPIGAAGAMARENIMTTAALLDVDGTLVDDNLLHVLAWHRAFERLGREVPARAILDHVGMDGDQLAPALLGDDPELVAKARALHREEYLDKRLIDAAEPFRGARELLAALRERSVRIALASSADRDELDRYLPRLGGEGAFDTIVSKEQVGASKPAPDVFAAALEQLGRPDHAFVVGDTVYDVEAAAKLGLPCVAVLSGGIERAVLERAGAAAIYDGVGAIAADLERALGLA
jgi:HAD superfamily hydrolase (TIGR01549 family)